MALDLTTANFQEEIRLYPGIALVDFHAGWCGPCRSLAPIVEAIEQKNTPLKVGKVDIDQQKKLAVEFKIRSIPTIILFKNGQEVKRLIGLQKAEALQSEINAL